MPFGSPYSWDGLDLAVCKEDEVVRSLGLGSRLFFIDFPATEFAYN